ncbi:MAG: SPOR domain-containing protein [Verrucomicrobia bacterium]|nr:SPOR domain-containing protein [Deltaproteobacteria bacterium]
MDIKFNKDAGGSPQQGVVEEKGKQNVLLIVLLVLAAGFGYIYFFTGLIKPAQEQKVAEAPAPSQVIKKPLPAPGGEPAKAAVDASETKKDAAPAVQPEPVKAAQATVPAAKPVLQEAAKPKAEVKKTEAPQHVVKKPLPVVAKAGENKPAPLEKKQPVVVEKKPLPAKGGEKKTAVAKMPVEKISAHADAPPRLKKVVQKSAGKEPVVSADTAVSGRWTVLVGNYVLEETLATDLARVRKAGLKAYVVPGAQKKNHMNRLLLAEFTDRAAARIELDKLKRHTSDAFMIDSAGMHVVYAGSYLLDARASSEKERLTAAGFSLTLKRADVAIPTKNLTAGSFAEKNAAEDTLKKLRAAGVKATLSR